MKFYSILSIFILFVFFKSINAQTIDDFADGDFTQNLTWNGTSSDFIINSSEELQSNGAIATSSYLSTPHNLLGLNDKEWRITVKQTFSPSSSNYSKVFLCSDNPDLTAVLNGYYLLFGESGSTDAIRLFNLTNGVSTQICAGVDGQIASNFNVDIRVLRNASGLWSLFADLNANGNYSLVGSGMDATNLIGSSFGVLCTYTISNATKFYFDDVYIGDEIIDQSPPTLVNVTPISSNQVDIFFNEAVTQASAENILSYSISPLINISLLTQDPVNSFLVHATLASNLINGQSYVLQATNISDLSGNIGLNLNSNFQYLVSEVPVTGDIIINEFLCDPSPVIGLPEVEFVEIYNNSTKIFNLAGYQISDGSSTGTINNGWILPQEYKVLTATSNVVLFTSTTAFGVTSFPSLNNAADSILIKDNTGLILDKLYYTDDWYQDGIKKLGGYSLELINPNDPCSDQNNWIASTNSIGGTPGNLNSVIDLSPDIEFPFITNLIALAPNYLQIEFNEGMDSSSLVNALYSSTPNLTTSLVFVPETFSNTLTLQFIENILPSQIYTMSITNASDCWNNSQPIFGSFALTEMPLTGEIRINEILQNPYNGGQDWIEIQNITLDKIFDVKNLVFANFDNDTISNFSTINQTHLLTPGSYAVIGKDSNFVKQNYPFHITGTFVYGDLPAYNNDSGSVYLYTNTNQLLDLVVYSNEWQFPLLDDIDGVSLERLDPFGLSSDGNNWHSAAETVQFGTPGRENSQYLPVTINGDFALQNEVFSPDNDGYVDVMQASFQLSKAGCLGTVTIFDDRGREVKSLFKNELLGTTGVFSWDGVQNNQTKSSIGVYVVLFEAFSIDGALFFSQRKAITVAGKI